MNMRVECHAGHRADQGRRVIELDGRRLRAAREVAQRASV